MGQKTNPNILRLGKTQQWKSKYIEKKATEHSTIVFRDLEIRKFISQLFLNKGFQIEDCKLYYSESSLHIYIAYYSLLKPLIKDSLIEKKEQIKTQSKKSSSKKFKKKIAKVNRFIKKKQFYTAKFYCRTLSQNTLFQNNYFSEKKTQRLYALKNLKTYLEKRKQKTLNKQISTQFTSIIMKGLALFTNKKQNIILNLKQSNKETNFLQKVSKKNKHKLGEGIVKLRKFEQSKFFRTGFNMLYNFVITNKNPKFLAEFIAFYFKKLKRPNFFLRFIKIALKTLITKNFSKFERIQIKIKGRFNSAPRSTHKFITIGKNIPVLTLNSKIMYGESTAYTSNGTFGIKVWTYTQNTQNYHV